MLRFNQKWKLYRHVLGTFCILFLFLNLKRSRVRLSRHCSELGMQKMEWSLLLLLEQHNRTFPLNLSGFFILIPLKKLIWKTKIKRTYIYIHTPVGCVHFCLINGCFHGSTWGRSTSSVYWGSPPLSLRQRCCRTCNFEGLDEFFFPFFFFSLNLILEDWKIDEIMFYLVGKRIWVMNLVAVSFFFFFFNNQ